MNTSALSIPVFIQRERRPRASKAPPVTPAINTRLIAAVRWDFERGLLSVAQLVQKYRLVMAANDVRAIASHLVYPGVKPQRNALAWCKRSWRLKNETN